MDDSFLINAIWAIATTVATIALYTIILCYAYKYRKTITKILLVTAVAGGLAVYYYGYSTVNILQSSFAGQHPVMVNMMVLLRAGISTAKMLVQIPDIAGIDLAKRTNIWYITAFIIVHAASLLLFIMVAVSFFGKSLNRFLRLISACGKVYIFFDQSYASRCLAGNISSTGPRSLVIFIGSSATEDNTQNNHLHIDRTTGTFLKVPGIKYILRYKDCRLLFLSDDEDRNATESLHVMQQLSGLNKKHSGNRPLHGKYYIRIQSGELYKMFEERKETICKETEYSIVNDPGIIALQMVRGRFNPAHEISKDTRKALATSGFQVMVLGFGTYGKAALSALIEYGQFVGSQFRATLIDKNIEDNLCRYYIQNPGIKDNYSIEPVNLTAGSSEFFKMLPGMCASLNRIVIALGDDSLNITTAIDIHTLLRDTLANNNIRIFAIVKGVHNLITGKEFKCYKNIHITGQFSTLFTEKIIINEEISHKAKLIHDYYNKQKKETGRPTIKWNEQSYIKRESNISAATHMETKLIMAAIDTEEIMKIPTLGDFRNKYSDAYLNLSKTEHLRWNAVYFVRGWQTLNITGDIPQSHQDHILCRHACLVDWEQLGKIEPIFNEPFRKYDEQNIDSIYELIHAGIIKQ